MGTYRMPVEPKTSWSLHSREEMYNKVRKQADQIKLAIQEVYQVTE
jgi:hypothetical protein